MVLGKTQLFAAIDVEPRPRCAIERIEQFESINARIAEIEFNLSQQFVVQKEHRISDHLMCVPNNFNTNITPKSLTNYTTINFTRNDISQSPQKQIIKRKQDLSP